MTLIPFVNHSEIRAADGPDYKVASVCAHPKCHKFTDHAHHIVRRSFIGGDVKWVEYKGKLIENLVGLCYSHHEEVTKNEAFIFWDELNSAFVWYDQPDEEPGLLIGRLSTGLGCDYIRDPKDLLDNAHQHFDGPASTDKCETCKRPLPRPKDKKEQARPRRTWAVTVPVDERENGAEVLDSLMDECRKIFGHDESKTVRYFTLTQALALVVQHADRMALDG